MTNLQRIRKIEAVLDSVRPQLKRDHGDIELVEIDGKTIYVNMLGACDGCRWRRHAAGHPAEADGRAERVPQDRADQGGR